MLPSPSGSVASPEGTQGTLWKWTNYISGWQPRWFVLDGGCLSYFLSANEVHLGSRGSLKLSSCDILVHPSDHQRMDMVMPGGRHIYLRAASMFERQQWLLALGVAKQGVSETDPVGTVGVVGPKVSSGSGLQNKMKDVQENCKLLMSHIASIRALTSDPSTLDPEVLSGLSADVGVACDQFLSSLEECMDLAVVDQQLTSSLKPLPLKELYAPQKGGGLSPVPRMSGFSVRELYPPSPLPPTPLAGMPAKSATDHTLLVQSSLAGKAEGATDGGTSPAGGTALPNHLKSKSEDHEGSPGGEELEARKGVGPRAEGETALSNSKVQTDAGTEQTDSGMVQDTGIPRNESHSHSTSDLFVTPASSPRLTPTPSPRPTRIGDRVSAMNANIGRRHETFFSSLSAKFEDLVLEGGEGIPSKHFLLCCEAVLPFFDTLSATAFAPVKADIGGNIKKLSLKYNTDPESFATLQAMVESELSKGTHNASNSATDALLWLKRAMEFVQHFIAEVAAGEHSLDVAAGKAYSRSLRRFHGWIVRGVFNLAMKAVPYHKDFLKVLGSLSTDEGERQVTADMAVFAASLGEIVLILNQFYLKRNLDPLPQT